MIVAASSGEFLGQIGIVSGPNWRLPGNFDARVAREQFLTGNMLSGTVGGGQFSSSDIDDSFTGPATTWQLYVGTYAVGKIAHKIRRCDESLHRR